ncbi:MAG: hypothetical protein PHQ33_00360 [Bacteroidales bacterium]|jgi:hypothetical protein|nr:hypothetical protein [Bacteroidales bacterium]MDD4394333.1 hypothetical protein [Bacteroidales bacterium]
MKKIISITAIALFTIGIFSACEQSDCLCRYYDESGTEVARDSWDGESVNASECEALENNDSIEVDDEIIAASSVSCSQSW